MTAILRAYVAEQYRLPAGERTPRELRVEMERAGVDPQQRAAIFEILHEGEVVRFHSGRTYPAHARNALGSALSAMQRAAASEQYAVATVRAEP
jgi:D-serine deaminase-like pyridoxal phosphate-dependent protein